MECIRASFGAVLASWHFIRSLIGAFCAWLRGGRLPFFAFAFGYKGLEH
jgi:hypothetical protein